MSFTSIVPKSPAHSRSPSSISMKSSYSAKKMVQRKDTPNFMDELKALEEKRDIIQNKISQLQARMSQLQQSDKAKNQKELTKKIIDDLVIITEEIFEIKRSVKEIMVISGQNESLLKKLRSQLESPQFYPVQRIEINKKIQTLLGEIQRSSEIKEKLESVLRKNEQQQSELKNVLYLSTIEDNFMLISELENKALQAENESIHLKIKNYCLVEENNMKLNKMNNILKEYKQQIQLMAVKINDLEKSKNLRVADAFRKVSKNENNIQNFSTPKTVNKSQTITKTTGGKKKPKTVSTFKFLANAFPTERSPSVKEQPELSRARSPPSCIKQKIKAIASNISSRGSQEQTKSPSNISSSRNTSASQLSQDKGLGASQNSNQAHRMTKKIDRSDLAKEKPSVAKIDLNNLVTSQKENFHPQTQAAISQATNQRYDKMVFKDINFVPSNTEETKGRNISCYRKIPELDQLLFEQPANNILEQIKKEKDVSQFRNLSCTNAKAPAEGYFGKVSTTSSLTLNDANNFARLHTTNGIESKIDDDSYCCYQTEDSVAENERTHEKMDILNLSLKQSVAYYNKAHEDEDDTCLIGSLSHKKLFYEDNKQSSKGVFLRDITNNYNPNQQSFQSKRTSSDRYGENLFIDTHRSFKDIPMLQDSEKKNPLDNFDD